MGNTNQDKDALVEFREFSMGFKQEAAKLAADVPRIINIIETFRRQIYAANAQNKLAAKQALATQVTAVAVVPTTAISPPSVAESLNQLLVTQSQTTRELTSTNIARTMITGDKPDVRAQKQLNASLKMLAQLNREIHSLALTQGTSPNANKVQDKALVEKIDQAIKLNATLRSQLNKDKVGKRHTGEQPTEPTPTKRRRLG